MKTLVSFLSEPVAVALGWTLLHALWQGFALVMPAALLIHLFRYKSSQLRYNVGVYTLLMQVAASATTFWYYYQPAIQPLRTSAGTALTTVMAPANWSLVSRSLPWHLQVQRFLEGHLTEIVVCWLVGVAVFLVRLAGGWLYVQRLKKTAVQPADDIWQSMLTRLSTRLAVNQSVQVLESVHVLVPMVIGALKPVILLPVGLATGLSLREAEAILAHELAHVKRFDYAVNLLQSVVEVIYFFHPALWWLSTRVREERENCCDDLAVLACGDARSLAQALARVQEFSQTPILAMALASQKKLLLNRVRRMLGVSARPVVSTGHLLALTLATVLLATASVYAIQQEPQPKPKLRKAQSLPTRQHRTPNGTEFGITDNRKVDYVIWGGQKLPAKRVDGLQKQLDKVTAGQLSLDQIAQPDRDILLAIIETNNTHREGMAALANGLAQINVDNMAIASLDGMSAALDTKLEALVATHNVESALKLAELDTEAKLKLAQLETVFADEATSDALLKVGQSQPALRTRLLQSKGNMDSLQAVREQNRSKAAVIRLQVEKQRFAIDAIRRKVEALNYDKMRLSQQRLRETMKQRQIVMKNRLTESDTTRANSAKQIAESERAIAEQEAAIERNTQQIIELEKQIEEAQKPIREAETQLRKLDESGRQSYILTRPNGDRIEILDELVDVPEPPELDMPEVPEIPEVNVTIPGPAHARPPRNRSARSIKGMVAPKPARVTVIPGPAIAPKPAPVISVRPARPPKPAVTPKAPAN